MATKAESVGVKDLVRYDNFKTRFVPKEFVESILSALVAPRAGAAAAAGQTKDFDPKPLIRAFDMVSDELFRLKKRVQSKIDDQEDQAAASESSRRRKMKDFSDAFDDVHRAFESLDSRLSEVGNTAIRIGEQLETIDKQRTRASEAKDLIQYFSEFNRGVFSRLDTLRRSGPEGEHKAAIIARRLNTIAKEVDIAGTEAARANIEKYCEGLEKNLLAEFDQAYSQADRDTMNQIARTLLDFNGGSSCVQTYVNQHAFFINLLKIAADQEGATHSHLDFSKLDPGLARLYEEIEAAIYNEWDAIVVVFPNAASVIQVFVQRIFAQSIQNYLEVLVERAKSESPRAYLQTLALSHAATGKLVANIHRFDEKVISAALGAPALTSLLNRCFEDLFVPYIENGRYINLELEWLTRMLQQHLSGQSAKMDSSSAAASSAVMSSFMSTMANTMNTVSAMGAELSSQLTGNQSGPGSATGTAAAGLEGYWMPTVDDAANELDDLSAADTKVEPDLGHLQIAKTTTRVLQIFQLQFQTQLLPLLAGSPALHREMILFKNELFSSLEQKVNALLQGKIAVASAWLEVLLSRQKKTDFKPRDDIVAVNTLATPVCNQIVEYVRRIKDEAEESLDGENLEAYLTEIGVSLHSLLLDHFRRFPVSYAGGLVLTKDLAKYHEVIMTFKISLLEERFDMLKELGTVFIVKPENLKTVLNEGYLGRIELHLLYPYLSLRADWSKLLKIEHELFDASEMSSPVHESQTSGQL
ncbi:Exocyst complex component 5 [Polyrhizophydium stewartii]|uniref:Exocyst complex component 5 n=1 Tax=Polyrhizophydium stewartii TaxID=2732419 RepID=A0ABR4N4F0_9FUNG